MSKKTLKNGYELLTEQYQNILSNLKELNEDSKLGFVPTKAFAFDNLITKAENSDYRIADGRYEVLKEYNLIESNGNISEDVKNVVLDVIVSPLGELHNEYHGSN